METQRKRILCFGDSLTWGWVPSEQAVPTGRYPWEKRWTGQAAAALGDGYELIEEGLSGRVTNFDDPTDPRLNASKYLPATLASHLPLDLVILMVGTNDTKSVYHRQVEDIAYGAGQLIGQVQGSAGGVGTFYPAPQVLLVSPPHLEVSPDPWFATLFAGGMEKTRKLTGLYRDLAAFSKVPFMAASDVVKTDGVDGIHFTEANNAAFGAAIAHKVGSILI